MPPVDQVHTEADESVRDDEKAVHHDRGQDGHRGGVLKRLGIAALCLLILAAGAGVAAWFYFSQEAVAAGEQREAARLVEVVPTTRGPARVRLQAMGTVRPAQEAIIRPRVDGQVVEQSDAFVPGGFFDAGDVMLRIDPTDYQQAVKQRESDLQRAQAALQLELGDQAVAREELERFEREIPDLNRELILRVPQLNQARAAVSSAEAGLAQARADLERTRIRAPFTGQVVERSVTVGNNVSEGDALATFVGSGRYWVEVAVPQSSLRWLDLPGPGGTGGSEARITHEMAWGAGASRTGRVVQLIGELEQQSRLARLLVEVTDPLARQEANAGKPRLLVDAFVDVHLRGRRLDDVAVIDRDLLRNGREVWVMNDESRLEIRQVEVAYAGRQEAYITSGLADGDRVVRTNLSAPVAGMLLRTAGEQPTSLAQGEQRARPTRAAG